MNNFFKNKKVVVTGACGTVGSELVNQLLTRLNVQELVCLDNNETDIFFLEQKFHHYDQASFYLADIRDRYGLERQFYGADVVFHAAAYKHVILCERSPFEAVQTNIIGINNVINASIVNNVKTVVFTSSDKAVNPTNVMGTSKLMGERLFTAANSNAKSGHKYTSTRFGNVLGSRGSVIPIFKEQIKKGGPVTLTHQEMTRFIMSIKEAVELVIDSALLSKGGEVLITKMPVIKISDLADVMIKRLAPKYGYNPKDIQIQTIGIKPGEKMYEELMSIEETRRSLELERYFAVLPAFTGRKKINYFDYKNIISKHVSNPYHSGHENPLSTDELELFLMETGLLDDELMQEVHPATRYWP